MTLSFFMALIGFVLFAIYLKNGERIWYVPVGIALLIEGLLNIWLMRKRDFIKIKKYGIIKNASNQSLKGRM